MWREDSPLLVLAESSPSNTTGEAAAFTDMAVVGTRLVPPARKLWVMWFPCLSLWLLQVVLMLASMKMQLLPWIVLSGKVHGDDPLTFL